MTWYRNIGWSFLSVSIRVSVGIVTLVVQARMLGPVIFGEYAFVLSAASLASLFMDFGMSLRALRSISANPDGIRQTVLEDGRLRLLLLLPFSIIALLITLIYAPRGGAVAYVVVFVALAFSSMADYCFSMLRAMRQYSSEAKIAFATNLFHAGVSIGAAVVFRSLIGTGLAFLVSRLVYVSAVVPFVVRLMPAAVRGENTELRSPRVIAVEAFPYAQDVIINNGMTQLDMIMAGSLLPGSQMGVYALANRGIQVTQQMLGAISNVFIPGISAVENDQQKFKRTYAGLISLAAGLGSLSFLGAVTLGPVLRRLIFGGQYIGLGSLWGWIGLALSCRILASVTAMPITGLGLQEVRARAQLYSLPVFLVLGGVGARLYGTAGLMVGGIACYGLISVIQLVELRKASVEFPRTPGFFLGLGFVCGLLAWALGLHV